MDTIDRLGILANTCTAAANELTRAREEIAKLKAERDLQHNPLGLDGKPMFPAGFDLAPLRELAEEGEHGNPVDMAGGLDVLLGRVAALESAVHDVRETDAESHKDDWSPLARLYRLVPAAKPDFDFDEVTIK